MTPNIRSATLGHKKAPAPLARPGAWSDLIRRPLVRKRIRSLQPGERVPDSEPRRYKDGRGYFRLRWKVGVEEYVETYEHRVFDGQVTTAPQVHHRNHDKGDNRPANLLPVTPSEHSAEHRSVDWGEVVALYRSGLSTPEVGARVGLDASWVYRILVAEGITPRSISESLRFDIDEDAVQFLHDAGVRVRRIAKVLGVSPTRVQRTVDELGLTPHREGRPTSDEIRSAQAAIERVEERRVLRLMVEELADA